jgi:hypothetical protein
MIFAQALLSSLFGITGIAGIAETCPWLIGQGRSTVFRARYSIAYRHVALVGHYSVVTVQRCNVLSPPPRSSPYALQGRSLGVAHDQLGCKFAPRVVKLRPDFIGSPFDGGVGFGAAGA